MSTENSKNILKLLRRERKKRGISQEKMAAVLEKKRNSYGHIETGKVALSAEDLIKICDFMGIKVLLVEGDKILN